MEENKKENVFKKLLKKEVIISLVVGLVLGLIIMFFVANGIEGYASGRLITEGSLYGTTKNAELGKSMNSISVWSPEGINDSFNSEAQANQNLEKLRLARTLSTTYDSYLS